MRCVSSGHPASSKKLKPKRSRIFRCPTSGLRTPTTMHGLRPLLCSIPFQHEQATLLSYSCARFRSSMSTCTLKTMHAARPLLCSFAFQPEPTTRLDTACCVKTANVVTSACNPSGAAVRRVINRLRERGKRDQSSNFISLLLTATPSTRMVMCFPLSPAGLQRIRGPQSRPQVLGSYLSIFLSYYLSIYLSVCLSVYLYAYVCMYACMHVCMYACMHVCMYACMHVCMYACMHACMYACMYVCMYVCIYIYIYIHTRPSTRHTKA